VKTSPPPIDLVLLDSQSSFADYCRGLEGVERLAVDTEFVGEKYYYPKLEVVQLYGGTGPVGIIDAPTISDWAPLAKLIGHPRTLKLMHAADQDLELIFRATGAMAEPLVDTQLAGAFLGYGAQVSLVNIVRAIIGEELCGKQTTSDWSHRPLTSAQLQYAASDVIHLHRIHEVLSAELERTGRRRWFEAEQAARLQASLREDADPREAWRRVKEWSSLSGRDLAILRELAAWREETAKARNLPRRTVLTDDSLVELARFQPETTEKAAKLRRINPGQVNRWFRELQQCIKVGRELPRDQWPQKPASERPDIPTGLLELCQALLRTEAESHGVAPTVLATTGELQSLIDERETISNSRNPLLDGWRRELVGERLIGLLQGRVQVVVGARGQLVFEDRTNSNGKARP
jgi:ribonuclease D